MGVPQLPLTVTDLVFAKDRKKCGFWQILKTLHSKVRPQCHGPDEKRAEWVWVPKNERKTNTKSILPFHYNHADLTSTTLYNKTIGGPPCSITLVTTTIGKTFYYGPRYHTRQLQQQLRTYF
jgi:hypothetical protein